jgi:hypothetical protein
MNSKTMSLLMAVITGAIAAAFLIPRQGLEIGLGVAAAIAVGVGILVLVVTRLSGGTKRS